MPGVIRAEMFGQLTDGLESAWKKLKGEGICSLFSSFSYSTLCVCEFERERDNDQVNCVDLVQFNS